MRATAQTLGIACTTASNVLKKKRNHNEQVEQGKQQQVITETL